MTDPTPDRPSAVLDLDGLGEQLRISAIVLVVVSTGGAVIEGVIDGLTFEVLIRWATTCIVGFLLVAAVLVAVHSLRGRRIARRRGESLSSDDVGLLPRRRREREDDQ